MTAARAPALPVPLRPRTAPDPWCVCGHRRSGHHATTAGAVTYCCCGGPAGQCPCEKFGPAPAITVGDYAASLVPWARRLVTVVHGDGGADKVAELLAAVRREPRPDDVDPLTALAVVLAALAPADVKPAAALKWVTWDWQGAAS